MNLVSRQWSVVSKSVVCFSLSVFLFALCSSAEAQQPKKVARIGYLSGTGGPNTSGLQENAFLRGLRDLGYIEGK
jgi:hypothetical protein